MKTLLLTAMVASLLSTSVLAQEDNSPLLPFIDITNNQRIAPNEADGVSSANQNLLNQVALLREQSQEMEEQERLAQILYTQNVVAQKVQTPGAKFLQDAISMYQPSMELNVEPKQSIVIPIGQGLLNTVATNFAELRVKTSDRTSVIESEGGTLYVAPTTSNPIGLVLYDAGVPESKISVTLVPIDAPPVIVDLTVGLTREMKFKSSRYLKDLELEEAQLKASKEQVNRSDMHTQRIIDMLTPVAQGDLPSGFTLSNEVPLDMRRPCKMAIPHVAGQRLLGGTEVIDVIVAKNDTDRVYQVREEQCLGGDVIAVGIYRKSYLQPNEEVEIYILRDKHQREVEKREKRRPRLTLGK
jgi:conjugal transfer pilus assembly protein TraK